MYEYKYQDKHTNKKQTKQTTIVVVRRWKKGETEISHFYEIRITN